MARPLKEGMDYFPLDCQLDDKFELIEAEYGIKGFAVVVKLFQKIYGGYGYYCEWTDEVALLFAKRTGLSKSTVSNIVGASIRRNIFSGEMFEKYNILTSSGIQRRYVEAMKRRSKIPLKKEYLLISVPINENMHTKTEVNVCNNSQNADSNTQSKVNKNKLNNKFNNFNQRDYRDSDMEELERKLLNRNGGNKNNE